MTARWRRSWRHPFRRASRGRVMLVGLPCVVVAADLEVEAGREEASCVVDRVLGHVAPLAPELAAALAGGGSLCGGEPHDETLPVRLGEEECLGAVETYLRRRLAALHRNRPYRIVSLAAPVPVAYPFWVRIYRRRDGRWSFSAVDAVGGRRAVAAQRRALVEGWVEADREDRSGA